MPMVWERTGKRLNKLESEALDSSSSTTEVEEEDSLEAGPLQASIEMNGQNEVTMAVTPPTFSGRQDEDVEKFLKRFDRAAEANRWTEATKRAQIPWYLQGAAIDWFERNELSLASLETIYKGLKDVFKDPTAGDRSYVTLLARQQSIRESPSEYIQGILRLCHIAEPKMSEREKIRHILRGLSPEYLRQISMLPNESILDLKQNLARAEAARVMENQRIEQSRPEAVERLEREIQDLRRLMERKIWPSNPRPSFQPTRSPWERERRQPFHQSNRHQSQVFLLIALTTLVGLTHARGNGGICPSEGLPASPCSLPPLVFTTGIILNETNCNQQFLAESFREVPRVQWSGADPNAFYTFLFIGTGPVFHWGVSNIPGSVLRGDGDITPFHQLAGVGEFRVFSFPVAYTALFFIGQTYWTYLGLQALAKKLAMTKSYDEFLHWISIGLFFISNFVVLTHWIEAPAFVRYIARWKAVQDELSPEGLHLKMRHPIILSAVLLLPCVSGFICLQVRFTGDDETISLLALIPFISSAGSVYSFLLIWVFTLSEIRHLADQLYNKILQVLEEGCLELEGERMSWLGLSGLASSLGEVLGLTGLAVLATALITFVPTSYGILAFFFDHSHISASFWGLVFTAATCVVLKANLCDSAHRTTQKIGNNFSAKILKLNLTHLPQNAMNEINLFLQTMKANPPEIQMHGFVTVNRSLFVSFVSNTVTYLVVLLQFKASSLSIPPDRDTNLSSTLPPSLAQH